MKKVFLLFGIAAFTTVSAQQNDLFDIQKHLLKKQAEENKRVDLPTNKPFVYTPTNLNNNPAESYTLPNGDKVVISSLDNMPVVQPDMRQF